MKLLGHLPNLLTHFHSLLVCQNCSCHFTLSKLFSIFPPWSPWPNLQTHQIFACKRNTHLPNLMLSSIQTHLKFFVPLVSSLSNNGISLKNNKRKNTLGCFFHFTLNPLSRICIKISPGLHWTAQCNVLVVINRIILADPCLFL